MPVRPYPSGLRRTVRSAHLIQIVKAKATLSDRLSVGCSSDRDLPDLLTAALVNGDGFPIQTAESMGAKEIGGVVNTHRRHHALLSGPSEGAHRSQSLHQGGVQTRIHHSEGLVVLLANFNVTSHQRGGEFINHQTHQLGEAAAGT